MSEMVRNPIDRFFRDETGILQGEEKYTFDKSNPFIQEDEESQVASVGYR